MLNAQNWDYIFLRKAIWNSCALPCLSKLKTVNTWQKYLLATKGLVGLRLFKHGRNFPAENMNVPDPPDSVGLIRFYSWQVVLSKAGVSFKTSRLKAHWPQFDQTYNMKHFSKSFIHTMLWDKLKLGRIVNCCNNLNCKKAETTVPVKQSNLCNGL